MVMALPNERETGSEVSSAARHLLQEGSSPFLGTTISTVVLQGEAASLASASKDVSEALILAENCARFCIAEPGAAPNGRGHISVKQAERSNVAARVMQGTRGYVPRAIAHEVGGVAVRAPMRPR
jgi:hypothetical protein